MSLSKLVLAATALIAGVAKAQDAHTDALGNVATKDDVSSVAERFDALSAKLDALVAVIGTDDADAVSDPAPATTSTTATTSVVGSNGPELVG